MESINSLVAFDAIKKTQFLNLALKYIEQEKRMPNPSALCNVIGISRRTLQRHLVEDGLFKEAFREILLRGRDLLVDVMYERGTTPGGYMDRITWLRHYFPEDWNPDHKIQISADSDVQKRIAKALIVDIDPEIIDASKLINSSDQEGYSSS